MKELKVHFLNVGQGDCTIIEFPSGRVGVIDIDNLEILDDDTRLEAIAKDPAISAQKLSGLIGISQRKIQDNLSKLKGRGLLKRIGPDKGGRWEVLK